MSVRPQSSPKADPSHLLSESSDSHRSINDNIGRWTMTPKTRDKWLPIIRQYERSSLTLERFAKTHGVNYWTFRNYYYQLRHIVDQSEIESAQQFLPVLVTDPDSSSGQQTLITLNLPGSVSLSLTELPPPQYLARVVSCLERAPL